MINITFKKIFELQPLKGTKFKPFFCEILIEFQGHFLFKEILDLL